MTKENITTKSISGIISVNAVVRYTSKHCHYSVCEASIQLLTPPTTLPKWTLMMIKNWRSAFVCFVLAGCEVCQW